MIRINKKAAGVGTIFIVIISILLFSFLFVSSCNAITKAFKSYKNSVQSMDDLVKGIEEVSVGESGSLKLVRITMDDDTGIYIFAPKSDMLEYLTKNDPPKWDGTMYKAGILDRNSVDLTGHTDTIMYKSMIQRPTECDYEKTCVCLCTEIEFKQLEEYQVELLTKNFETHKSAMSGGDDVEVIGEYKLDCKTLTCKSTVADVQKDTNLKEILTEPVYSALEKKYDDANEGFIFRWEGGISFWKTPERDYLFVSHFADLYIIKNIDGTIRLCFDSKCAQK